VWVLPNRRTPGLGGVLVAMWYAGASQGNGAAYLLCFVLIGLALVSIVHAWTNLRGITVDGEGIPPAFVGEELAAAIAVTAVRRRSHFALKFLARPGKSAVVIATLQPQVTQRIVLRLPAERRGCFREFQVRVSSSYPLGFFTARQHLLIGQTFWVYPAPRGAMPLPRALAPTRQPHTGTRVEGDDYGGVRVWQTGESQRHIDWKAAARGQPLLTKQWTGEVEEVLRLDWHSLSALDTEERLSQLAKWVVLAERGTASYELLLPGKTLSSARGDTHYHACLRALAEFTDPAERRSV
jgi:uncharacterized protein (DUF58 family)